MNGWTESSFEDHLIELKALNRLIIVGVLADLKELGPGIPFIVKCRAGDTKTAEDECFLLLLYLLLAESDVCISKDQVILIIVYHCLSWVFPHVVGLAVRYAEDEALAWLLDVVLLHWVGCESADLCTVGEMHQDEQVGDAIDILMEVCCVERVEPMDQSSRCRYLSHIASQGVYHPADAFSWDDRRTVEELSCPEAGHPLVEQPLNLLLQFVAFIGTGSQELFALSCEMMRGLQYHHFVDIVNNPQRSLVVVLLFVQIVVETGNV